MKSWRMTTALALCLTWAGAQGETVLVNDLMNDTDRIGGLDGSVTLAGDPVINMPTATNTQWVVNGTSSMVASATGMYWTMNNTSNRMTLGYFPGVTIGAGPVTFTLKFRTGTSGTDDNNLRMALVDSRANGYVASDGFGSTDPAYVGDLGYAFNSAASNVGGGSMIDLVMRTAERVVTTSNNLLGTAGDWGADGVGNTYLVASTGSTGYLQPDTDYTLAITMSYNGSALTVSAALTGGNLAGLTWSVADGSPASLYFDTFAMRWGGGSLQFSGFNLTEFKIVQGDVPPPPFTVPVLVTALAGGSLEITCPSVSGYLYQLESSSDLGGLDDWSADGAAVAGDGSALLFTRSAPAAGGEMFYRVAATEIVN